MVEVLILTVGVEVMFGLKWWWWLWCCLFVGGGGRVDLVVLMRVVMMRRVLYLVEQESYISFPCPLARPRKMNLASCIVRRDAGVDATSIEHEGSSHRNRGCERHVYRKLCSHLAYGEAWDALQSA